MYRVAKYQNIYGMARVGYSSGYEIYVNTDDPGNIPHFHYRDKNNWNKFHTCIQIESAEYFHHTGKEDVLNSKQRKDLDEFMYAQIDDETFGTSFKNNWELVCLLWNINNSSRKVNAQTKMPDYRDLPTV